MITLGLDTATSLLSVAIVRSGETLSLLTSDARRGQSEALLPMIEKCCQIAKIELDQIERIGAVTGPGSFTGLRIGLAAMRGLAMGLGIPAYGVSAFEAARLAVPEANVTVLESWREELFVQFGSEEPEMLTPAQILAILMPTSILAGDAVDKIPDMIKLPALAPFAAQIQSDSPLDPYYLREPDVTQAKA